MEVFIAEDEAGKILGKSIFTLRNWRVKKYGPRYFKVGHNVRYKRSDVLAWIEGTVVEPLVRGAA